MAWMAYSADLEYNIFRQLGPVKSRKKTIHQSRRIVGAQRVCVEKKRNHSTQTIPILPGQRQEHLIKIAENNDDYESEYPAGRALLLTFRFLVGNQKE
ncbi:MAG: hypothetical protein ACE5D7_10390 [Fidelibacterota bacterium]